MKALVLVILLSACASDQSKACSPDTLDAIQKMDEAEAEKLLSTGACDEYIGRSVMQCPAYRDHRARFDAVYAGRLAECR